MAAGRPGRRGLTMPGGSGPAWLIWPGQGGLGWAGRSGPAHSGPAWSGVARGSVGQTCWAGPLRLGQLSGRRLASQWARGPTSWPALCDMRTYSARFAHVADAQHTIRSDILVYHVALFRMGTAARDGRKKGNSSISRQRANVRQTQAVTKRHITRYSRSALQCPGDKQTAT